MALKCFYSCYGANENVSSGNPITIDRKNALYFFEKKVTAYKDFIGFVDHKGNVLQIMMDEDKSYWVELPCPEEGGSYGKRTSMEDISSLLRALPLIFEKKKFPSLEFHSWQG